MLASGITSRGHQAPHQVPFSGLTWHLSVALCAWGMPVPVSTLASGWVGLLDSACSVTSAIPPKQCHWLKAAWAMPTLFVLSRPGQGKQGHQALCWAPPGTCTVSLVQCEPVVSLRLCPFVCLSVCCLEVRVQEFIQQQENQTCWERPICTQISKSSLHADVLA